MKIVIVGAGAIGLLIGTFLAQKKHEITYVTKTLEQAQKLRKSGVTRIQQNKETFNFQVKAVNDIYLAPTEALWIIAVKAYHLSQFTSDLHLLPSSTPLLFIQNGLAHLEIMEQLNSTELYIATIEHGAMKKDSTTVLHTGVGLTKVAPYKTSRTKLDSTTFQSPNFKIEVLDDAYTTVLRKAILNACINPLTAVLQIKNGELATNIQAKQVMKSLFDEIHSAFPEIHQLLTFEDVLELCNKTANNHSSMLQDIQNNRKTEIESIAGAIISLANARKKELPVLSMLYQLVLAFEEKGDFE